MSEELLAYKDRGAIAILTASREAYASPNAELNKLFFKNLFNLQNGKWEIGQTSPKQAIATNPNRSTPQQLLHAQPTKNATTKWAHAVFAPQTREKDNAPTESTDLLFDLGQVIEFYQR